MRLGAGTHGRRDSASKPGSNPVRDAQLDVCQFDYARIRREVFALNDCPNGPGEDGSWPCDPMPGYGGYFAECQVCGRIGECHKDDAAGMKKW